MKLTLLAVGRLRPSFREATDDYLLRLRRMADVRETEVREAGRAGPPPVQRREEAKALRSSLPDGTVCIALDQRGEGWSSEGLAHRLGAWRDEGRAVAFIIGGAVGLDDELLDSAAHRWSLGALTLPHELARVVVAEQVYRAFTILRGEPYHKGDDRAR
ncbi:MAG: 23S rRNA (pseudouridine(1915)-N(3))-methyltransferase RlmH [Gemmatimonadota bacterium]|nr:23S rRNA (pseudouridine(1915)-N(3))-methyltransferase RlmH [Gemmatimonadota bacterium]